MTVRSNVPAWFRDEQREGAVLCRGMGTDGLCRLQLPAWGREDGEREGRAPHARVAPRHSIGREDLFVPLFWETPPGEHEAAGRQRRDQQTDACYHMQARSARSEQWEADTRLGVGGIEGKKRAPRRGQSPSETISTACDVTLATQKRVFVRVRGQPGKDSRDQGRVRESKLSTLGKAGGRHWRC